MKRSFRNLVHPLTHSWFAVASLTACIGLVNTTNAAALQDTDEEVEVEVVQEKDGPQYKVRVMRDGKLLQDKVVDLHQHLGDLQIVGDHKIAVDLLQDKEGNHKIHEHLIRLAHDGHGKSANLKSVAAQLRKIADQLDPPSKGSSKGTARRVIQWHADKHEHAHGDQGHRPGS